MSLETSAVPEHLKLGKAPGPNFICQELVIHAESDLMFTWHVSALCFLQDL